MSKSFKPKKVDGKAALWRAGNATTAALAGLVVTEGEDVEFFSLKPVAHESILIGCTDPLSDSYDIYAEVDIGTC